MGASMNTNFERLPTLSEVSSVTGSRIVTIPSLTLGLSSPCSPSHSHSHANAAPEALGLGMGKGSIGGGSRDVGPTGLGLIENARPLLGSSLSWLQNSPRGRQPKFSPWEDKETKDLEEMGESLDPNELQS